MHRRSLSLSLLAVLITSCTTSTSAISSVPTPEPTAIPVASAFRIIAYATEEIAEKDIPYDKLTHINYAFLTPKDDGTFNPINNDRKLRLIVQNGHAHNIKVLISVGGWGWDAQFETMAAKPKLRSAFVQNLKAFVDEYQLDGADIDWEFPDAGQSSLDFLALVTELHDAMPNKLLTAAAEAYGDNGMHILSKAFELFDYINVMSYDGPDHGSMNQFQQALLFWTARGLPREKLVMGVPFYARSQGSSTEAIAYSDLIKTDPAAAQVDKFEYAGATEIYNGIPTIQAKTKLAMQQAGGIMFWDLDDDAQGNLSLVNAIYQTARQ